MRGATRSRSRPMRSPVRPTSIRPRARWSARACRPPRRPCGSRGARASMPSFDYLALDTGAREQRRRVRADTVDDARALLDARRFYVVRIEGGSSASAPSPSLLSRKIVLRRRLSAKQLTLFTRQLATLAQVAPLEEALRTIARQAEQEQ